MKSFGTFDNFKCFDVLGFQFYCDDFVGGGGGSGGGGGAGRSWPEDSSCKNDAGQIIDCDDAELCYEFLTDDTGILPVTKKTSVSCRNGSGKVCYDDNSKIVDCSDIYTGNDRMCMHLNGVIDRGRYGAGSNLGGELYLDKIPEYGLTSVPCNDVIDCMSGYDAKFGKPLYVDCNTPGPMGNYVQKAGEHNGKYVGYYPVYPIDLTADRLHSGSTNSVCVHNYDEDADPFVKDYGVRADGSYKDEVDEHDPCFIYTETPSVCYDELGFKVDCNDLTTILKIPRSTDIPYIYPNTVEVPPLDCDICQFFDECMAIFDEFRSNFWTMMNVLYEIRDFKYLVENISNATSQLYGLAGFTQGFFPQVLGEMMALITDIKDLLKDFNITLPDVPPVNPEEPPSSNLVLEVVKEIRDSLKDIIALLPDLKPSEINFSDELFKLLKEIKKTLEDLKMEIIEEAGTSFWDFLGGLFGDIFELIEFLIEKIIYLVVPEDSSFITTSLSGLSDALSDKFEPMDMLKDSITSSLKFEEKEFEKLTVDLPVFGNVQFFDPTYINMAIPKLRQLISGMMVLFTAFWAYRKITTEMIK